MSDKKPILDYIPKSGGLTYDELLTAVKKDRGTAFDLAQFNREIVQLTGSGKATIRAGRLVFRTNSVSQESSNG